MEPVPFIHLSLYQMFHIFIFWSIIGWGIEVCYMTIETGEYQNRGFLNMPMCPIYGFGVIIVTTLCRPIAYRPMLLFLVTSVVCTAFELLIGLGMEKLFGNRWWDYSHEKFNYKGYICLKVSILWGLGCVFVVRFVAPLVVRAVNRIPDRLGMALIGMWSVLIVIDLIASICAVNKLNNRLRQIDEISKLMLKSAVKIGGKLARATLSVEDKYDETKGTIRQKYDEKKDSIKQKYDDMVSSPEFLESEWKERYDKLLSLKDRSTERILKAFPSMRSINYPESMEKLRGHMKEEEFLSGVSEVPEEQENEERERETVL